MRSGRKQRSDDGRDRDGQAEPDTAEFFSRPVSGEVLASADVVVTLGLSVGVVHTPEGVRREDWRVGDPVGASIEEARRVRKDIERRVRALLEELEVTVVEIDGQNTAHPVAATGSGADTTT